MAADGGGPLVPSRGPQTRKCSARGRYAEKQVAMYARRLDLKARGEGWNDTSVGVKV
jgi:hypothetical protein